MSDTQPKKHELKYLEVDLLKPNAWNVQTQSEATFQRLCDEISDVGFIDPVEVVAIEDGSFRIIGGEHRWQAAKKLGLDEIPCIILQGKKWNDTDLQKFVSVRVNTIRGKVDPEKFILLYEEMAEKYGKESLQQLLGYTDAKAFDKVVNSMRKGLKKSLPPELMKEFDKAAKDAKTVEDLEKIVQMLFAKHGDTVDLSYMVFTYGKAEHFYVQMSTKTRKLLNKMANYCKLTSTDINVVMAQLFEKGLAPLLAELDEKSKEDPKTKPEDPSSTPY